jgi:hypothetical protein
MGKGTCDVRVLNRDGQCLATKVERDEQSCRPAHLRVWPGG